MKKDSSPDEGLHNFVGKATIREEMARYENPEPDRIRNILANAREKQGPGHKRLPLAFGKHPMLGANGMGEELIRKQMENYPDPDRYRLPTERPPRTEAGERDLYL